MDSLNAEIEKLVGVCFYKTIYRSGLMKSCLVPPIGWVSNDLCILYLLVFALSNGQG